jgi:putative PIG3 family NAD(P)H quinone oxidoreductase
MRRYVAVSESDRSLSIASDRIPTPGADEVLIAVEAAGINRADLLQRRGLYPPPADASPIMGLEVAGRVLQCGEAVQDFEVGDRVCALTHGGGYASHAVAPQGQTFAVPGPLSAVQGAALPEALLTVWHNLFQRCGLRAGENVLIHGGASGIGTMAVSVCNALGATVYTTAGTAEKCRRLQALGAERAFNYREEDFVEGLSALGLKDAMHVILDMVGGDYVQRNLAAAAPEGRIVNIAFMRGFKAEVNFLPLLMKRLTLTGSTLRAQTLEQKTRMVRELRESVLPLLERGTIAPVIDSEFPLAAVEEAHARMESGEHMGKIVLTL